MPADVRQTFIEILREQSALEMANLTPSFACGGHERTKPVSENDPVAVVPTDNILKPALGTLAHIAVPITVHATRMAFTPETALAWLKLAERDQRYIVDCWA